MTTEKKEEKQKMNLHQKIVVVRKEVLYLQKEAQGYKYSYATEGAIFDKIRPAMDKLNVLLEIELPEIIFDGNFVRAKVIFTWVDADCPTDKIEKTMIMIEAIKDFDIKKCGGILTYAMKYFLFKFLTIETGNDPDEVQGLSEEQIAELESLGDKNLKIKKNILEAYKAANFSSNKINPKHFKVIQERLQQIEAK